MTLIIFEASRHVNGIDSVVLIDESQIRSSKELNLHAAVSIDVQAVQPVHTIGPQYSRNDRSRHLQGWFELQRAPSKRILSSESSANGTPITVF
jgi:hypothetical protein